MMKKNGFTLAEVLITLAIIGVVATMTLPALIANTGEQQAKTALKKGISTLTEMAQMNQAIDGYDYAGLRTDDWGNPDPNSQCMYALFANRGNIDLQKSQNELPDGYENQVGAGGDGDTPDSIIFFRDGSAVLYNAGKTAATDANATLQADGLPYGFVVIFDTNGQKGPNILSNCKGKGTGEADDYVITEMGDAGNADSEQDIALGSDACNTKANRVIKDQFTIRLRGGFAQPEGAAAIWAYNS